MRKGNSLRAALNPSSPSTPSTTPYVVSLGVVQHQIRNNALIRLAGFLAKRHKRRPKWGIRRVAYTPGNLGLVSLDGTVRPPRPFRDWRRPSGTEHRR